MLARIKNPPNHCRGFKYSPKNTTAQNIPKRISKGPKYDVCPLPILRIAENSANRVRAVDITAVPRIDIQPANDIGVKLLGPKSQTRVQITAIVVMVYIAVV